MDREILYLNNNLVNSLLAQHNGGLISNISSEGTSEKKMAKGNKVSGGISSKVGVDASAGLGKILSNFGASVNGNIGAQQNFQTNRVQELSEGQKDMINKTFHDYSLTILLEDLADLVKSSVKSAEIGDIVKVKEANALFDFELLSELLTTSDSYGHDEAGESEDALKRFKLINDKLDYELIERIFEYWRLSVVLTETMQQYYEENRELIDDYRKLYDELATEHRAIRNINIIHKYLDNICLLRIDNAICLVEKEYLYEPSRVMIFRINDQKKLNIFGRVINIIDNDYGELTDNLSFMPLRMIERFLKMIELIEPGMKIIEPIALYY